MGIGMPESKRLEKLRIWWPGAAIRAGAQRAVREIPGAGGAVRQDFPKEGAQKFELSGKKRPSGNVN